jgi:hypothetical protein
MNKTGLITASIKSTLFFIINESNAPRPPVIYRRLRTLLQLSISSCL